MPYTIHFESQLKADDIKKRFHTIFDNQFLAQVLKKESELLKSINLSKKEQDAARNRAFCSTPSDIESRMKVIKVIIDSEGVLKDKDKESLGGSKGELSLEDREPIFHDLDKELFMMFMYCKLKNSDTSKCELDTSLPNPSIPKPVPT